MHVLLKAFGWILLMTLLYCTKLPAQGISDELPKENTVVAEKGDGVFSLLRRHGLSPALYREAFLKLNVTRLKEGKTLYLGETYVLPTQSQADSLLAKGKIHNTPTGKAISDTVASPPIKVKSGTISAKNTINKKTVILQKTISNKKDRPVLKSEVLKSTKQVRHPIFGEQYAEVTLVDEQLKGTVYYLISGHGGPDPGAVDDYGMSSLSEDEYAYDVTLRLARKLISHGATVYIIIRDVDDGIRDDTILMMDTDELCYPAKRIPRSQRLRLKQRTDAVNRLYYRHQGSYQRLIALHLDSRSQGENIDVFFYHHHNSQKGKKLAHTIHGTFQRKYARYQPNREYHGTVGDRSGLYVIKNTLPPVVFIELGNIKNEKDKKRFLITDNRQALAKWIGEGVIKDYQER